MLEVLAFSREHGLPTWIRQVVVPGWNDTAEDVSRLKALVAGHPTCERIELLPYHTMGCAKWQALGRTSPFAGTPALDSDTLRRLQSLLE
jgi:pyruvate formate lyase activating enzyme